MANDANPVLIFENVFKRSNKKMILRDINLTLCAGEILTIIGGGSDHKMLLARMICGQLYPDEGRIHRLGPPGTNVGLAMGFNVGGTVLRGLEMRAAAYDLDPGAYIAAVAALLSEPEVMRQPLQSLNPTEKMTILYGSSYLLPCTHFVNNSGPLPLDKRAKRAVRPVFRQRRNTAGVVCFAKKLKMRETMSNQRFLRLHNGWLMAPEDVPTAKAEEADETKQTEEAQATA